MINFCCDDVYCNVSMDWLEEEWLFVYDEYSEKWWPTLKSFSDYEAQEESFKIECQRKKLDPESQKRHHDVGILPYPTCTRHQAVPDDDGWGDFSSIYPNTEQVRFIDYCYDESVNFKLWTVDCAPTDSFYIIGINVFHHDFDYFSEISKTAFSRLKANEINVLFFYDEADCPLEIKKSLSQLCQKHGIDNNRIYFISNNTYADNLKNFYYFFDDELLYRRSRQSDNSDIIPYHENKRDKRFTALVRIDRPWRAYFMANLWERRLHENGYFSYNRIPEEGSYENLNPFQEKLLTKDENLINNFLDSGPFKADSLSDDEHNNFEFLNENHFENSYCNFVVETYFANPEENTYGRGITEKILKPICHNQFFVVVGPPHTLKKLHELGYKTFGRYIDESYDDIEDNETRMEAVIKLCSEIAAMSLDDIHDLYLSLKPEITHNSKLFFSSKAPRLTNIINKLTNEN